MRRLRLPLVVVLMVVSSACSILPPEVARDLLPSQTQYKTAEAAFSVLIERHVARPTSTTLIPGALDNVLAYLKANVDQNATIDRPQLTGNEWSDFGKLTSTLDAVVKRYPSADRTLVERAAVEGMAKVMNECHTYYLDPDRAKTFNKPPAPVSGIGVTINKPDQNSPIEVIDVIPNTPAERAGVKKGDKFMKVNGEDVSHLTVEEVADRVRGPEGTTVNITFDRQGAPVELTIPRARFTARLTEAKPEGDYGYIKIKQLISNVADEAQQAAQQFAAQGKKGIVLDLRNDPGGELSVAVDVASLFVKNGPIVYQTGRDGQRTPIEVNSGRYLGTKIPLVVLVNKNSASGSEIIAAGVQASGAGTIMGAQTAGCVGSAQPRELPDGGLLLITLTEMQDAKTGANLNGPGKGIVPDVTVSDDPSTPNVDEGLQAALDYLRAHA